MKVQMIFYAFLRTNGKRALREETPLYHHREIWSQAYY